MATVHLPRSLVALFPGAERRLDPPAGDVAAMIEALDGRWPGMADRLCEPGPRLREHINVFVDGERGTLETRLGDRSVVHVIPAVSGGAPTCRATSALGFIGLGVMGRPMARNLLRAGHRLTVHTRTPATAGEALDLGAAWADTPAAVARASDVVITMLPDTPDVERVLVGSDGILAAARPGLVVIDMSTIDPEATRLLAGRLAATGSVLLDAPVSGGERGAIEATLSIMVGGPGPAFEQVRPILDVLGRTVVRVGESGAGQVAKACNQLVVGANIEAVAEALSLAGRAGVDPAAVRDVLLGGFAASRVLEVHGARMLERRYEPGFRARLHAKDARIIRALAAELGAPIPAFEVVADAFDRLVARGGGELDHSALATLLEEPGVDSNPDRDA